MRNHKRHSQSPIKQPLKESVSPEKKLKKVNKFFLGSRERYIVFSCDFDSGNIECVKQLSEFQYRLGSVPDNYGTIHEHNSKSWFYFSVTGFPKDTRGRFYIEKVQALLSIQQSKYSSCYRPVYKVGEDGQWYRLPTQANLFLREDQTVELCFQYLFRKETDVVYFAFCYPFSYTDNLKVLQGLSEHFYIDEFYYHQEVLIMSAQKRLVHLLTISSHDQIDADYLQQLVFDSKLFPENNRPTKFRKPVVLITARVHPAETSASHAMRGILKFLTSKNDLRAYLLRQMFVFMIVPMINVDGVFRGHFRMDTFGNNLNRHYDNPDPQQHPAVYAIKSLAQHLQKERRLTFYFDLHAHNAKKGCFFYGNAINDFVDQVESQVFCKLFSMNCKNFEYESCNFSMKHMKARDRFEDLTKEGCGRVVMHKLTGIIHSFSLECGLVSSNQLNTLADPSNIDFKVGNLGFEKDRIQDNNDPLYSASEPPMYTPAIYQNVGKALMVSILDTFDKNPYNRVYTSQVKSMQMLRRMTAFDVFHNADRFRMFERFIFHKVKNINQLMKHNFKVKFDYNRIFNLNDTPLLKSVQWPSNILGLRKEQMRSIQPRKIMRNDNLYTGNSEEDMQNDFMSDILLQLKEIQSKQLQVRQSNTNVDRNNVQTSECLYRQPIEREDDRPDDDEGCNGESSEQQSSEKQSPKRHLEQKSPHKQSSEFIPNNISLKNGIHSRGSGKHLIQLGYVKHSAFVNIIVPEQLNRRKSLHYQKLDLRLENQKRKLSRKQFDRLRGHEEKIDKLTMHHNNFKLALMEQTSKESNYNMVSKIGSNLRLNNMQKTSENSSKELRRASDSLSKSKKMQMLTVKIRQLRRYNSRIQQHEIAQQLTHLKLPEINQEKLYPYATAGAFMEQITPIPLDLNEMFSNTLKFQALKMKQAIKCVSRQKI